MYVTGEEHTSCQNFLSVSQFSVVGVFVKNICQLLGSQFKNETIQPKMTYCKAFALALNALLLRSNAFVVPTRRARAIGIYQSLKLERNDKLGTSVDKKSKFQIWERLPDQRYDPSPTSSLQQQLENFLAPVSDYLDNASDGWALSYADLTPNR